MRALGFHLPQYSLAAMGVFFGAISSEASEVDPLDVVAARSLVVEGQRAWIDGGFGRLTEGAGALVLAPRLLASLDAVGRLRQPRPRLDRRA